MIVDFMLCSFPRPTMARMFGSFRDDPRRPWRAGSRCLQITVYFNSSAVVTSMTRTLANTRVTPGHFTVISDERSRFQVMGWVSLFTFAMIK
jgi:hypothetical protein